MAFSYKQLAVSLGQMECMWFKITHGVTLMLSSLPLTIEISNLKFLLSCVANKEAKK